MIEDNFARNTAVENHLSVPFIVCVSHRFNLAVNVVHELEGNIIGLVHNMISQVKSYV